MKDGSLISAEIVCKLIENVDSYFSSKIIHFVFLLFSIKAIRKSEKKHFLLDGFPRDQDNVNEWRKTMSDKYYVQCVLVFDCDERTSIDRCLERGKQSGRKDDNEESLNLRIVTYNQSTRPIIELYEEKNLVQHIDASKDVDKVHSLTIILSNEYVLLYFRYLKTFKMR